MLFIANVGTSAVETEADKNRADVVLPDTERVLLKLTAPVADNAPVIAVDQLDPYVIATAIELSEVLPNLNMVDLDVRQTVPVVSTNRPDPCSVCVSPIWLLFPNHANDAFQRLDPISLYSAMIFPVVVIVEAVMVPSADTPVNVKVVGESVRLLVAESYDSTLTLLHESPILVPSNAPYSPDVVPVR